MNNADIHGNRAYWLRYARVLFYWPTRNHFMRGDDSQLWLAIFRAYFPKEMQ